MDTQSRSNRKWIDFTTFITRFFPNYQIDETNEKIITSLSLWANRDSDFNGSVDDLWHIDRGILLSGPVGAGKDEMFRVLRKYISYLNSPYGYDSKIVWEMAGAFSADGYACFESEKKGNRYYEELALTEDATGMPVREFVSHYGNKLLIGAEIITMRHVIFKQSGFQSHFSTNLNEDQLERIYGKRCISRLLEMCNFMYITGNDRRRLQSPVIIKNKMKADPPAPRETTVEEHKENKAYLEAEYAAFCKDTTPPAMPFLSYNLLIGYGCVLASDEEMREFMEDAMGDFSSPMEDQRPNFMEDDKERKERAELPVIGKY